MEYNITISQRAKDIVKKYVEIMGHDAYNKLIVSMYALQQNANHNVLSALAKYNTDLNKFLSVDEIKVIMKEYRDIVKFCTLSEYGIFNNIFVHNGIPLNVIDLCSKILMPNQESNILLANSDLGQFSLLNSECYYYGYENSLEPWALSQILLDAFERQANIQNSCFENALSDFGKQYDYIFTSLPNSSNEKIIINELISLAKDYLKENGHMCCLLLRDNTYNMQATLFREMITSSPHFFEIEVIEFQDYINGFGPANMCILYLTKNHSGKVTLVDATQDISNNNMNSQSLSWADNIIKLRQENDSKYIWHGIASNLKENYNICPSFYMEEQYLPIPKEGEKLVELRELVELIQCPRNVHIKERQERPTVGIKNLTTNYWNCVIKHDKIIDSVKGDLLLSQDALLFGYTENKTLIAKLSCEEKTIALSRRIIPFMMKTHDVITEDFLLRALTLRETLKQVQLYANGVMYISLTDNDFLKLKIIVPSLAQQNEICKNDARAHLSEIDKKLLDEHEDFRRDMHMKKHAIGQTIHDFRNWWDILQKVRIQGNGNVNDNAVIGITKPISVSNIYDNLEIALSRLEKQIYSMDRGNGMIPENIALADFIDDYIKYHQNPQFEYVFDSSTHRAPQTLPSVDYDEEKGEYLLLDEIILEKGEALESAKFPREALEIIFDNIISNAREHGFANRKVGNKIRIDIIQNDLKYIISIANNGEPINHQLSSKDVFTYGRTSKAGKEHFGIGGYEVYRLMREFNGDAELILSPNEEYTVTYNLIFNDTNAARLIYWD